VVQVSLFLEIDLEPMIDVDQKEALEYALFKALNFPRPKRFFLTGTSTVHLQRAGQILLWDCLRTQIRLNVQIWAWSLISPSEQDPPCGSLAGRGTWI
jgi:hypothetical protein